MTVTDLGLALELLEDAYILLDQNKVRARGWTERFRIFMAHLGEQQQETLRRAANQATIMGWNERTLPPAA